MHADQTHGINDLRVFYLQQKKTIPVYADNATKKYLLNTFRYCFKSFNREYPATLKLKPINNKLTLKDGKKTLSIKPIKVRHGKVNSICYIFDKKLAYISDISEIMKKDFRYFKNLKYLIIDCLWFKDHPSHLNLEKSLMYIGKFKPNRTILTNLHSDLDYNHLKRILPKNITPAYDGLTINL
tara:strand:- start:499 stop:1047 length:549 start_codon:yes stop_codon:yes gene_type:complete